MSLTGTHNKKEVWKIHFSNYLEREFKKVRTNCKFFAYSPRAFKRRISLRFYSNLLEFSRGQCFSLSLLVVKTERMCMMHPRSKRHSSASRCCRDLEKCSLVLLWAWNRSISLFKSSARISACLIIILFGAHTLMSVWSSRWTYPRRGWHWKGAWRRASWSRWSWCCPRHVSQVLQRRSSVF